MLLSALFAAAAWPTLMTSQCEPSSNAIIVGVAQDESGQTLYCEIVIPAQKDSLNINYLVNGKVFAEKNLNFSAHPFLPAVSQHDFRNGERRVAKVTSNEVQLSYQASESKKINKTSLSLEKVDVVDAGFDNFVRARWDELAAGNTISINFASIAHLRALPLRVRKQPLEKCSLQPHIPEASTCFLVEVDNALLRIILGNIKLIYDEQKRLQEYNGVVNIQSEKQGNQSAIIHYHYRDDYHIKK